VHLYNDRGFRFGTTALVASSSPEGPSKDGHRTDITAGRHKENADEVE
jgi:hypothetical protein